MDTGNLHVVHLGFFLDPEERNPMQLMHDWWPLVDTAEMVARSGAQVTVIQACARTETLVRNGVTYHFLSRDRLSTLAAAQNFACLLGSLHPHVLHVHGLNFPREILALSRCAPGVPILLQDHADGLPRFWRRAAHHRALSRVAGVAFCALEQTKPFREARLLKSHMTIFEIPECSSRFMPGEQTRARAATGVHGGPAVLWVGHLDSNKDPLTVLAGIAQASLQLPNLQLFCCFGRGPLLRQVEHYIAQDPRLSGRVHLLGKVPHQRIETLMQAADLFVLGSHHEGSGCALIEALACGLAPVVTAIPSFRTLTGEGRAGALWRVGEPADLCRALEAIADPASRPVRLDVRGHFDRELSFDAVARKWRSAYESLIRQPQAAALR